MWNSSLIFLFFLLTPKLSFNSALASDLAFSRNARTFETQEATLITKGLAHSCLSLTVVEDGLPCNPANVPFNRDPGLSLQGLLSNGYSSLEKTQKLLRGDTSAEFLDNLFAGQNVIQIEGQANLNFVSSYLNAKWTPDSVRMFTVVRNEANPSVEIFAVEEKGFTFQTGLNVFSGFYFGLQGRVIERRFVRKKFLLLSLATQQGRDSLMPNSQRAYYLEPGFTWIFEKTWQPRISAMIANLGAVDKQYDELPIPREVQFGMALSPPIDWGNLDLLIDYKGLSFEESPEEKLHLGSQYQFGSMNLVGGIDFNGMSAGLFYKIEKLNAGILFSTTELPGKSNDYYSRTVYAELGWKM